MKIRTTVLLAISAVTAMVMAVLPVATSQDAFPEGPGRDTLLLACTQCHSLGKMVVADLTADDWQFIVYDMIGRGAPVHDDEIADLTKYLQDNFTNDKE